MKKYFKILVPVLAVMLFVSCASAQYPVRDRDDRRYDDSRYENDRYGNNRYGNNWMTIARTRVSRSGSSERVNVNSRYGNIRQLLFSSDGSVNIYRVAVRYSNGRTEELNVRNNRRDNRRENNYSNDLIVSVPSRGYANVRQVIFWYDTDNYSRNRPTISVYAR
ncbi:MAG: hypothetical protein BGN92_01295 [Sphingobacteriales bacterium 41-5]|nr:MAG: hypothetical protein ABS67_00340 [Niabella sp. SCN 42-15]OJU27999.1 MAG: hypothetical protein BGN92_01295 [Sphingobacteriales bacterium 41-5]